jgi:hypothetical protein
LPDANLAKIFQPNFAQSGLVEDLKRPLVAQAALMAVNDRLRLIMFGWHAELLHVSHALPRELTDNVCAVPDRLPKADAAMTT